MPNRSAGALQALVFSCFCALAGPISGAAQTEPEPERVPPLQGVVIDEATYEPVDSAVVRLLGTNLVVTTGRWGQFAFPDAPLGNVSVQVAARGHPSIVEDVEVGEDRIVFVQILLPSVAAVLSELLVRTGPSRASPVENARTAADLLALRVPHARVNPGMVGQSDFKIQLRPGTTFQGTEAPLILIDGVVMSTDDNAFDALERIPASDVAEIEILKGPAAAFLYPYAANGVVNVKTRKGAGR